MKKLLAIISLALMLTTAACKSSSAASQADKDPASHAVAISLPAAGTAQQAVPAEGNTLNLEQSQDYTTIVRPAKSDSKPRNIGSPNGSVSMIPKATAFRMSGDYANNVAVTVDSQGNLTYFPAPTDITPASAPLSLADGWWLNRQGIGINSVFTKYTFEQYAALPSVPTIAELKAAIIPGARVTEMITLPYTLSEAPDNIPAINTLLESLKK